MQVSETRITVTDNTINNIAKASTPYSVAESKYWGALVWRDLSEPGGLGRTFLKSRDKGKIILINPVNPGDYIEMAHKLEVYSKNADPRDYHYFRVIERLPDQLVVEKIEAEDVPPKHEQKEPTAEQKSIFAIEELAALQSKIVALESKAVALETCLAQVRNISNRLRRKHNEGKLPETTLNEELINLSRALVINDDATSIAGPEKAESE